MGVLKDPRFWGGLVAGYLLAAFVMPQLKVKAKAGKG